MEICSLGGGLLLGRVGGGLNPQVDDRKPQPQCLFSFGFLFFYSERDENNYPAVGLTARAVCLCAYIRL